MCADVCTRKVSVEIHSPILFGWLNATPLSLFFIAITFCHLGWLHIDTFLFSVVLNLHLSVCGLTTTSRDRLEYRLWMLPHPSFWVILHDRSPASPYTLDNQVCCLMFWLLVERLPHRPSVYNPILINFLEVRCKNIKDRSIFFIMSCK